MSREAMEAVQDHSQITDPFGHHIFVTIGRFIAADSKTGWASDRTIAELARCDKDSVGAWRERLIEAGEIETWTTGAGRGTRRWYKFLLPFDQQKHAAVIVDDYEELSQMSRPEGDNNEGDNNGGLSQRVDLLSQRVEELSRAVDLLSQIIVPNVPPRGGQEHHSTNEAPKEAPLSTGAGDGVDILVELPEPFKPKYSRLIPPALQTDEMLGVWANWEKYQHSLGKFTEQTARMQLKDMSKWGQDKAIEAIKASIKNGWKGIFEPKPAKNGRHAQPTPVPSQGLVEISPGSGRY